MYSLFLLVFTLRAMQLARMSIEVLVYPTKCALRRQGNFFLPQKKRQTEHGVMAMLLGPAFIENGRPRVKELREQGKKNWRSQSHCTSLKTVLFHACRPCPFSLKRNENQILFVGQLNIDHGQLSLRFVGLGSQFPSSARRRHVPKRTF